MIPLWNVNIGLFTVDKIFPENAVGKYIKHVLGLFQWKTSRSKGISEKVMLFFRTEIRVLLISRI